MLRPIVTDKAPPPFSAYSQATRVSGGDDLVFVSGQVGVGLDGKLAATVEGQHETAWANLLAILASEGLGPADIAEVTAYLTDAGDTALYRTVRDRMLAGATPASTLLVITALAHPDWKVEIAAVARAARQS